MASFGPAQGWLRSELLRLIRERPQPAEYLVRRIDGARKTRLMVTLSTMKAAGQIVVIGTAEQAKLTDVYRNASVYALPGTPVLPKLPQETAPKRRVLYVRRKPEGSGVIAPPPYRTGYRWGLI